MNTITKLLVILFMCGVVYGVYMWVAQPCVMKYPGVTRPEFPVNYRELYLDD